MPVRLPDAGADLNIWVAFQDMMRIIQGEGEYIEVVVNGDEPPTVKQYTRFWWYNTNTYTPPADATGNPVYPASTSTTYLESHGIYEDGGDTAFTWSGTVNGETFPAKTDGTWYLYCAGGFNVDENSKGKGLYNVSKTETPTWAPDKGGYISASGYRILAEFTVTGGVVALTRVFNDRMHRDLNGDMFLKNNTLNRNMYIALNDGGTIVNAITFDGSELTDGQTTDAGIIFNRNFTFTDVDATMIIPMGVAGCAFSSAAARAAGVYFNTTQAYYHFRNTAGAEICRISAASSGESYLKLISQDGTYTTRLESSDADTACYVKFGDAADDDIGRVQYNHDTDAISFWNNTSNNLWVASDGGINMPNMKTNGAQPGNPVEIEAGGELYEFTSGSKYKENIRNIIGNEANWLYDIDLKIFDGKEEYGGGKNVLGLIAEDLVLLKPDIVAWRYDKEKNGKKIENSKHVSGYSRTMVQSYLILEIQNLNKRLLALEA